MGFFTSELGRLRLGWRILLFLFLALGFFLLFSLVPFESLPLQTLPVLLGGLLAGWVLLALDSRTPGALGFHLHPEALRDVALGLILGVGVSTLVLFLIFLTGALRWTGDDGTALSYLNVGATSLLFFLIPAAAEEVLMRGYLFQALAEAWGGPAALWLTSIVFALLHLGNPNLSMLAMGNLLTAGLFLGVTYLKTASLWWATAAHAGWNWALGFLGDVPVSGMELLDAPLVQPVMAGPTWLSGGAFGPEASVVATVVLAAATLLLWRSPLPVPGEGIRAMKPLILSGSDGKSGPEGGETPSRIVDSWRPT